MQKLPLILLSVLLTTTALADEREVVEQKTNPEFICNTIDNCQKMIGLSQSRLLDLIRADAVKLDKISKRHLTYRDALVHCQSKGMRLPTIRELALEYRAVGIRHTAHELKNIRYGDREVTAEIDRMSTLHFKPIYKNNGALEPVVDFYFNDEDARRVTGSFWLWTASLSPFDNNGAYVFNAPNGNIEKLRTAYSGIKTGVRCAYRSR